MKVKETIIFYHMEDYVIWGSCEDGKVSTSALCYRIQIGTWRVAERENFCLWCCQGLVPFMSRKYIFQTTIKSKKSELINLKKYTMKEI